MELCRNKLARLLRNQTRMESQTPNSHTKQTRKELCKNKLAWHNEKPNSHAYTKTILARTKKYETRKEQKSYSHNYNKTHTRILFLKNILARTRKIHTRKDYQIQTRMETN